MDLARIIGSRIVSNNKFSISMNIKEMGLMTEYWLVLPSTATPEPHHIISREV